MWSQISKTDEFHDPIKWFPLKEHLEEWEHIIRGSILAPTLDYLELFYCLFSYAYHKYKNQDNPRFDFAIDDSDNVYWYIREAQFESKSTLAWINSHINDVASLAPILIIEEVIHMIEQFEDNYM